MEQKYLDKLSKYGFVENIDSVKTVLECRAYHNTYSSITDSSYAVICIPTLFSVRLEKKIKSDIASLIQKYYFSTIELTHFPCISNGFKIIDDNIQLTFSNALSLEKISSLVISILEMVFEEIKNKYREASSDELKTTRIYLAKLGRRVRAIQIFIEAGSTSYNYTEKHYHPFD